MQDQDVKKIMGMVSNMIDFKLKDFKEKNLSFRSWQKFDSVSDVFSPITGNSGQIGFYGTSKQPKQIVTGSRGGNAALQTLLTALSTIGLITDNSS